MKFNDFSKASSIKARFVDILVFIQILCPAFFYYFQSSLVLYFFVAFIPLNLYLIFKINKIKISYIFYPLLIFFILFIFSLLSEAEFNASFFSLIMVFFNTVLYTSLSSSRLLTKLVSFAFLFFSIIVFLLGVKSGFEPDYGNNILDSASRNYVSAILIIYFIAYSVLCLINKVNISVLLSIFLVINCIFLYGRTGTIISILLLIFVLFVRLNKFIFYFSTIVSLFIFGLIYNYIIENTGFSGGLDTPRNQMLVEYFYNMSSKDVFFGRSFYECCTTIVAYGVNPHNSFIAGHHVFGIFHWIIAVAILIILAFARCYYFVFLLLVIYLRYWYDVLGLFYLLDFPIFIMLFYAFSELKKRFDF